MSFHLSSHDVHIREENGSTMLLAQVRDHTGKLCSRKIRLDDHIGNSDGYFIWDGANFTRSARNIGLEASDRGPKLTADLEMHGGGTRGRQGLFLADKIANVDGHLKFLGA
ncbi:Cyanovirin-N [Aspergillus campestris IBT 28561]|uniref:Cyanovirin-N n=1 Tax=Aspergillus campestris (strain IBT 28561) TaxID=1392248 RepID=A0A2I1CXI7_ASPC2|nr:Cyanovirin-N [Aspergillus campestris IBT 28561]PKY02328.1 Cyanovirin-N [Aspergillus campestris IBT 28561]